MDYEYHQRRLKHMQKCYKGCLFSLVGVALLLIVLLLTGCRTYKQTEETVDTVRTEYIEKIVEVPVVVTVEVPAEAKERETRDSTSFLETSFAQSTAEMKWKDGVPYLFHTLENKPQKIEKEAKVPVKEKTKTVYRTRCVTRTLYKTKDLAWYQKLLIMLGGLAIIMLIVTVVILRYRHKKCYALRE